MESFDEDVRHARASLGDVLVAFLLSAGPALVAALIIQFGGMDRTTFILAMPFGAASLCTILGVFLGQPADWRRTLAYGVVAAVISVILLVV